MFFFFNLFYFIFTNLSSMSINISIILSKTREYLWFGSIFNTSSSRFLCLLCLFNNHTSFSFKRSNIKTIFLVFHDYIKSRHFGFLVYIRFLFSKFWFFIFTGWNFWFLFTIAIVYCLESNFFINLIIITNKGRKYFLFVNLFSFLLLFLLSLWIYKWFEVISNIKFILKILNTFKHIISSILWLVKYLTIFTS